MILEYLAERKAYYQKKSDYFYNLDYQNLARDFKGVVDLITEMEKYIQEKENGV